MRPRAAFLAAFAWAFVFAAPAAVHAADNAAFSAQSVPTAMTTGQTSIVSVTMQNTGTTTWAPNSDLGYKLIRQHGERLGPWLRTL